MNTTVTLGCLLTSVLGCPGALSSRKRTRKGGGPAPPPLSQLDTLVADILGSGNVVPSGCHDRLNDILVIELPASPLMTLSFEDQSGLFEEEGDLVPVQSSHTPTQATAATTFTAASTPNPQAVPQPAHRFLLVDNDEALHQAKKRKLELAILGEDLAIKREIRQTEEAKAVTEEAKAACYKAVTQKLA